MNRVCLFILAWLSLLTGLASWFLLGPGYITALFTLAGFGLANWSHNLARR